MGTDIHGRLQTRFQNERYADAGPIEDDRNYRVFAMLAGVRNGYGFAGCKTHESLVPISEPRGLPDDLGWKDRWKDIEYDACDFGDHSYSWVTLREILDWPYWDSQLVMTGVIDRAEFDRLKSEGGDPKSWCGGHYGPGVIVTTIQELTDGTAPEGWTDVTYEWQVPFRQYSQTFRLWIDYLESKYRWMLERDPESVRLVFGFDS